MLNDIEDIGPATNGIRAIGGLLAITPGMGSRGFQGAPVSRLHSSFQKFRSGVSALNGRFEWWRGV